MGQRLTKPNKRLTKKAMPRPRPTAVARQSTQRRSASDHPSESRLSRWINFFFVALGTLLAGVAAVIAVFFSAQQTQAAREQLVITQNQLTEEQKIREESEREKVDAFPLRIAVDAPYLPLPDTKEMLFEIENRNMGMATVIIAYSLHGKYIGGRTWRSDENILFRIPSCRKVNFSARTLIWRPNNPAISGYHDKVVLYVTNGSGSKIWKVNSNTWDTSYIPMDGATRIGRAEMNDIYNNWGGASEIKSGAADGCVLA